MRSDYEALPQEYQALHQEVLNTIRDQDWPAGTDLKKTYDDKIYNNPKLSKEVRSRATLEVIGAIEEKEGLIGARF